LSRGALVTGAIGGITGTITAGIGMIWSLIEFQVVNDSLMWIYIYFTFPIKFQSILYYFAGLLTPVPATLMWFFDFSLILSILLIISGVLTGVGFYGMYQAGAGATGIVGLVSGIIGGTAGGIFILLGNILTTPGIYGVLIPPEPNFVIIGIGFTILAVCFIMLGYASIKVCDTTDNPLAAKAAGILSIVGGGLLSLYLFIPYAQTALMIMIGFGLILVAFILWAIVFYSSRGK
jgi:hypothetical protein